MVLSIVAFLVVFSIVVVVHELGHFIAARKLGVDVREFSIGFPLSPRLCTLFRHRETEFTLRLLPLGGFVGFADTGALDGRGPRAPSRPARAVIMAAGAACNIAFAGVVFFVFFLISAGFQPVEALVTSLHLLGDVTLRTVLLPLSVLSGQGGLGNVVGPVGIASMAGKAAGQGIMSLWFFGGSLSISLGIVNLFPLPALDGGRLAMLAVETVLGKQPSPKVQQLITAAGLVLFLVLSLAVTVKDIVTIAA